MGRVFPSTPGTPSMMGAGVSGMSPLSAATALTSGDVISTRLVTFKSVSELIEQNRCAGGGCEVWVCLHPHITLFTPFTAPSCLPSLALQVLSQPATPRIQQLPFRRLLGLVRQLGSENERSKAEVRGGGGAGEKRGRRGEGGCVFCT